MVYERREGKRIGIVLGVKKPGCIRREFMAIQARVLEKTKTSDRYDS
jgi:hypothetical protein